MYNVKKVNEDLYWIGASDRRLALFENIYPIPRGVSYNSYVILDEQKSGACSWKQTFGLYDRKPYGTRSLCNCGRGGKKIPGSEGCGKCQDL